MLRVVVNFVLSDPAGAFHLAPPPPDPVVVKAAPRNPDALTLRMVDPADFPERRPTAAVSVSQDAKPIGCDIVKSSGTDAGDVAICRHLMRLKYGSARGRDGRKIASPFTLLRLTVEPRQAGH
jgi:hypothetical protein